MPGAVAPVAVPGPSPQTASHGGGLFGGRRRQLEADNDELASTNIRLTTDVASLRTVVDQLKAENARLSGLDRDQIEAEASRLRGGVEELRRQIGESRNAAHVVDQQAAAARTQLVQVQEEAMLQEAGVYAYLHPLDDAIAYKGRLVALQDLIKSMVRNEQAVLAATNWTVNGSRKRLSGEAAGPSCDPRRRSRASPACSMATRSYPTVSTDA
jgi:hypothetical protein